MMKRGLILIVMLRLFSAVQAQDTVKFKATTKVDSAYVHVLPSEDAKVVASLFRDNRLEVVSRNLDGSWFEVKRPGRLTNLGWVFNKVIDWDFPPEDLPLGDLTTGAIGPNPLTKSPPYGAFLKEGLALRVIPDRTSHLIINIPALVTIPVMERNQDGSWLHVNYMGYDGWLISFAARIANVMDIPEAKGLPPLTTISVIVIPPEIQQAQIDRLRAFINKQHDLAVILQSFWWDVFRGAVKPCEPPAAVLAYSYADQDVRELPELDRLVPRVMDGITYINESIGALATCGVLSPDVVVSARNDAINARGILDAELERLKNIEQIVQDRRNKSK